MIVTAIKRVLNIVAQDHGYDSIDVEGARSDNGSAARAAVEKLCPDGFKAGCFTHEIFKAQLRHKSWTVQLAPLEHVWNSDPVLRASGLHPHQETFGKEYNAWMHLAYRCPGYNVFEELGNVSSDSHQLSKIVFDD